MIVLDTNVVSALMRPENNPTVVEWVDRQEPSLIWTTAVTVMEIWAGLHHMPEGRRRAALTDGWRQLAAKIFRDRILALDAEAAEAAARIAAHQERLGVNADIGDFQIAGIVRSRQATLATRNLKDFQGLDIELVNPWSS